MPVCVSLLAFLFGSKPSPRRSILSLRPQCGIHGTDAPRPRRRGASSLAAVLLIALFVLVAGLTVSIACVVTVRTRFQQRTDATNSATQEALGRAGVDNADDDRDDPVTERAQR